MFFLTKYYKKLAFKISRKYIILNDLQISPVFSEGCHGRRTEELEPRRRKNLEHIPDSALRIFASYGCLGHFAKLLRLGFFLCALRKKNSIPLDIRNCCKYIVINDLRDFFLIVFFQWGEPMDDEQKNLSPIVEKIWSICLLCITFAFLFVAF